MLVGSHDGAVDHRIFVVSFGGQMLKPAATPSFAPAAEPPAGVLPVAKALRQVAPRNAGTISLQHRLDKPAIVVRGYANIAGLPREQVLDPLPLIVTQAIPGRGSAWFQADPP
jgi:hypothetical protein